MTPTAPPLDVDYILPLRWDADTSRAQRDEMTEYLYRVRHWADVVVVDGSEAEVFAEHHRLWSPLVRHLAPEGPSTPNGKVGGVLTGIRVTGRGRLVIADDDVRYGLEELTEVVARLDRAGLCAPQNHFGPLTWHARWDTARTLINRAFTADYPGTLAVRRDLIADGYRADVLFENLELVRTVMARGGQVDWARGVYVRRLPPTARHFWGQRVRQAYDSHAQPARLAAELLLLPAWVLQARCPAGYLVWLAAAVAVAERGRRVDGGGAVYERSAAWWAPIWLAERAVTAWIAVAWRLGGGVPYAGGRLRHAASSLNSLRRSRHG
ncbi:glycosyltransferase [Citricoccus sp. GCM10030269]|uniref:glycosyltransferase n=1 Tax=Citricoccus sp. GCM10030269 TaxID=3273388 RepID=UPI003609B22C